MAARYLYPSDIVPQAPLAPRPGPDAQVSPRPSGPRSPSGRGARGGGGPYSITSTPESHSADMGRRMVVYGVQMLLRVACLVGFLLVEHWGLRIILAAGAVLLPWSAVMLANVGADRTERSSSYLDPAQPARPALDTGAPSSAPGPAAGDAAAPAHQEHEVIEGQTVRQPPPLTS